MEAAGSFGAGRAGGAFEPLVFIKQPQTVLKMLAWIFSMVVFGSIVNEGYVNHGSERLLCVFNRNDSACGYVVAVGILAFLATLALLALDIYFPQISSVKDRRKAVLVEIGVTALWTFLWFVGFCFLANQWNKTKTSDLLLGQGVDAARAAVTFSFFSSLTWAGLSALAVRRYRLGTDMKLFTKGTPEGEAGEQPYPPGNAAGAGEIYHSPPFSQQPETGASDFQVPAY